MTRCATTRRPAARRRIAAGLLVLGLLPLTACNDLTRDAAGQPVAPGPERSRQISECSVLVEFARGGAALDRSAIAAVARAATLAGLRDITVTGEHADGEDPTLDQPRAWLVRRELRRWGVPESRIHERRGTRVPPAPGTLIRFCDPGPRTAPTEPDRLVRYRMRGALVAIPLRNLPPRVWNEVPYEPLREAPPDIVLFGAGFEDQTSVAAERCRGTPARRGASDCRIGAVVRILPRRFVEGRDASSWPPPGRYDEAYFPLPQDGRIGGSVRCTLRPGTPEDPIPEYFPDGASCVALLPDLPEGLGAVMFLRARTVAEISAKLGTLHRLVTSFIEPLPQASDAGSIAESGEPPPPPRAERPNAPAAAMASRAPPSCHLPAGATEVTEQCRGVLLDLLRGGFFTWIQLRGITTRAGETALAEASRDTAVAIATELTRLRVPAGRIWLKPNAYAAPPIPPGSWPPLIGSVYILVSDTAPHADDGEMFTATTARASP